MTDSIELQSGLTRFAIGEQLATTDTDVEILRVYAVQLVEAGTSTVIGIEVPLRYDLDAAARRDQDSPEAHDEAFRYAVKTLRKAHATSANAVFEMGRVEILRSSLRPARRKS